MPDSPTARIDFVGGFESTYLPRHDVDVFESTGHSEQWRRDLLLMRTCGVRRLRYPVRWHRIEAEPGRYDWTTTDEVLGHLHDEGFEPIVDLVHHTSYPAWLAGGFADPRFAPAYLRFAEAVARRYPWIREYTLFNEPFSTLFLSGHEGVWPPYHEGLESFAAMLVNVVPAIAEAARRYRELLPGARHVWVDACERHTGAGDAGLAYAGYANDRRFVVLDAVLGRLDGTASGGTPLDERPFARALVRAGAEALVDLEPAEVDVVGLDYYAHCQWHFGDRTGRAPTPQPAPLADLVVEYATRYGRPCLLSETNIRGYASDRATWLKYTLEQCEQAVGRGVELDGYCWFPFVDSCDWDSLLAHHDGNVDPVGVFSLCDRRQRHPSSMSVSFAMAAHGSPSSVLPAYELRQPVRGWLAGWLPQMAHWTWQPAPDEEHPSAAPPGDEVFEPLRGRAAVPAPATEGVR